MGALPREAVIEHQHLIGSALPFANQPGSGLRLGTNAPPGPSPFLELLCNLAELALTLRDGARRKDFLHPVCDGSQWQLAAEVRRCIAVVESAPLLAKLTEIELGEARERIPASRGIFDRAVQPAPVRQCGRSGCALPWPMRG